MKSVPEGSPRSAPRHHGSRNPRRNPGRDLRTPSRCAVAATTFSVPLTRLSRIALDLGVPALAKDVVAGPVDDRVAASMADIQSHSSSVTLHERDVAPQARARSSARREDHRLVSRSASRWTSRRPIGRSTSYEHAACGQFPCSGSLDSPRFDH